MKLKEYAEILNKLAEQYPELTVVYTNDSEMGTLVEEVNFVPTLGFLSSDGENFAGEEKFNDEDVIEIWEPEHLEINAIRIT